MKIQQKIISYEVSKKEQPEEVGAQIEMMNEQLGRPELLQGSTYKIKTPTTEHAVYITINDVILNEGSEHEIRHPFEIFINSKNMEQYQWISALTRVMSGVFRKGGDATFLVEELKNVFDPKGGYFKKGGVFVPSLVAEIGIILEHHLKRIGLIKDDVDENVAKFIASKKQETGDLKFPPNAQLCTKCHTVAVVISDGCSVCLNCGDSRCG